MDVVPLEPGARARSWQTNCQDDGPLAGTRRRNGHSVPFVGRLRHRGRFRHGRFRRRWFRLRYRRWSSNWPRARSASASTTAARSPRLGLGFRALWGGFGCSLRFWRWLRLNHRCSGRLRWFAIKVRLQRSRRVRLLPRLGCSTLLAALQALAHPFTHIALVAYQSIR
jgi:hypothetical protein